MNALVLQVDVFSAAGAMPKNLWEVQERVKDIQYASKRRFNTARVKETAELRGALHRLIAKLPNSFVRDPDAQRLKAISTRGTVSLLHFINRHNTPSSSFKDCEFSRATVTDLWNAGLDDACRAAASG
jgi:NTE family protein